MVLKQKLTNPPCPECAPLGHISAESGNVMVLLTLAPDPMWNHYGERYPDSQHKVLHDVLHNKIIKQKLKKYYNHYEVLSEHYEFHKNGNLHSHCLIEIPKSFGGYDRNLHNISKHYSKIIGMQGASCQISCNTKWVTDNDIFIYLNKENAYDPYHFSPVKTLHDFFESDIDSLDDSSY